MSLSKQLIALVVTLVLLLFVGTFVINLQNTRSYLNTQLRSHAQDAATSLGLSATTHMAAKDAAMVRSMSDVVFDSGDYLQVRVEDLKGTAWVDRRADLRVVSVPQWFMDWAPLETPEGTATMMAGWRQAGLVKIRSHPGYAYEQLWSTAEESLLWFLASAFVVLLLGVLALRWMLRPLKRVEQQAEAICNREFPVVEGRPFTTEFRRVVEAMNRLSNKVRQMLSDSEKLVTRLREQAFQDEVSGLANRRQFMDVLKDRLGEPGQGAQGTIFLVQLKDFKTYNQEQGYAAGDRLLKETAGVLGKALQSYPGHTLARMSGADYAVLIPDLDAGEGRILAEQLAEAVGSLYGRLQLPSADVGHIGAAHYLGAELSDVLAEADKALREAQRAGANRWVLYTDAEVEAVVRGAGEWRALLQRVLAEDRLVLAKQPVLGCGGEVIHQEIFLRISDPERDGALVNAGQFLPMVENAGLAPELDRAMITRVVEREMLQDKVAVLALNLSPMSLREPDFIEWLVRYLEEYPDAAARLVLEVPEYGASTNMDVLHSLIRRLSHLGVQFSLDHFGTGFSSFTYLSGLKAHFIKIDGSFVRSLEESPEHQFFIQALGKIAHGLDMRVIAESVETESVWTMLPELGVDGGRGYWLGRPE